MTSISISPLAFHPIWCLARHSPATEDDWTRTAADWIIIVVFSILLLLVVVCYCYCLCRFRRNKLILELLPLSAFAESLAASNQSVSRSEIARASWPTRVAVVAVEKQNRKQRSGAPSLCRAGPKRRRDNVRATRALRPLQRHLSTDNRIKIPIRSRHRARLPLRSARCIRRVSLCHLLEPTRLHLTATHQRPPNSVSDIDIDIRMLGYAQRPLRSRCRGFGPAREIEYCSDRTL